MRSKYSSMRIPVVVRCGCILILTYSARSRRVEKKGRTITTDFAEISAMLEQCSLEILPESLVMNFVYRSLRRINDGIEILSIETDFCEGTHQTSRSYPYVLLILPVKTYLDLKATLFSGLNSPTHPISILPIVAIFCLTKRLEENVCHIK